MSILAIDPGLKGGLAIVGKDGLMIESMPLVAGELDLPTLVRWVQANRSSIELAVVEKAQAMPKQGVSSMFNYGVGYGMILGILSALGVPYELVPPQRWSKVMHAGISKDLDTKERSALAVSRIFPGIDFRSSSRCKKPHEGMVDAALIAEWAWRQRGLDS